ncbi:DUF1127 domain-containing protein [Azospirillum rugosum]|uniref:Uncharacterized protein YjiS (DUF1127 family) n=1 Tax=Azospirillum rugosum TaxID=416170 RepID=A0ABS4SE59_9PROT|nr:DUF1127 domain-containing protein [Azospirillum rugosum]MBP2290859.1 uncharacterized protein YjiS (DUF1127 family) [Azospirillum rugosum]MDQ0529726.1 uncharacterized protein YjiS (DUF1127 family) [Azospirillum rugosum]
MTQSMNNVATAGSARNGASLGRSVMALFDVVATWNERRRQRLALEALPDHLLHDIGLSRADAVNEAEKPFWRG